MAVSFSPVFNATQLFTTGGLPLSGGLINTYLAGTSTPAATYTTSGGTIAGTNPIVLGPDGRPPTELWLTTGVAYKFILTDSLSNLLGTFDNIIGILSASSGGPLSGITDLTTTGNTILGSTGANTLNVDAGAIVKDASGNLFFGGGKIGQNAGQQHTIPAVASDTFALLAATQTLTNKTINGAVGLGQTQMKIKGTTTARTSSPGQTADPDLTFALGVGTYTFEVFAAFSGSTTGTQGFKGTVAYSGTATAGWYEADGVVNATANIATTRGLTVTSGGATISVDATNTYDWLRFEGFAIVSSAGNLAFGWGQFTTNTNATNVIQGSWMRVVQIA